MAIREILYNDNNFTISYNIINNQSQKYMVFLHGWGSNKEVMIAAFQDHFKQFNHVYIDLPGFGASPNECFLTTNDYAYIVNIFLQSIKVIENKRQIIIVGHSFGGKVALLLEHEIILLSSAGILLPKPFKVRLKIKLSKLLKYLPFNFNFLRADDARTLSPVMYDIFKSVVDEDFSSKYKNFTYKTTIFWGKDDTATPMQSYNIICGLMPNAKSYVLQGDHYFFLKQGDIIEKLYYGVK